jgi:hypothetical protein
MVSVEGTGEGIGLVLVETAAAASVARGRLLLVQVVAQDREGLGLTRKAVAEESSNSATSVPMLLRSLDDDADISSLVTS